MSQADAKEGSHTGSSRKGPPDTVFSQFSVSEIEDELSESFSMTLFAEKTIKEFTYALKANLRSNSNKENKIASI
jgi:hypothetical protein